MLNESKILQSILDNSQEGIVIMSLDFKVIYFSQKIHDLIFEISNKKIQIGHDFRDFIKTENKDLFTNIFLKVCQGETIDSTKTYYIPIFHSNYEYKLVPIFDENHKDIIGINFSAHIISKEKAEDEIEKLNETIDSIFSNTTESFILLDKNYKLLNFNKAAFERMKKNSGKELYKGADFKDFVYEGREKIFDERYQKALNGENFVSEEEVRFHHGEPTWVRTRIQPIYNKTGNILGVSVFWNYITEKKLAEIALLESEEKFRRIVDASPVPIIITDEKLSILLTNLETKNVFGYDSDELYNQNIRKLIPKRNNTSKREYLPTIIQRSVVTKKGENLIIEFNLSKFQVNNKRFRIIIIQNVTQRVEHESLIADQIKRLEAIAWHHSHIIRRPLANILGAYDLIQTATNDGEKQEYLELLHKSTKELDEVIQDIVKKANFGRIL